MSNQIFPNNTRQVFLFLERIYDDKDGIVLTGWMKLCLDGKEYECELGFPVSILNEEAVGKLFTTCVNEMTGASVRYN